MTDNSIYPLMADLIRQKIDENDNNPFLYSPFGPDTDGQFINQWTSHYNRIAFFARSFGVSSFSADPIINVFVPVTGTGMAPVNIDEQPYSWNGKINLFAAESALWHAFEILTENEAREFMQQHAPEVIFQYMEKSHYCRLTVQFSRGAWRVVNLE